MLIQLPKIFGVKTCLNCEHCTTCPLFGYDIEKYFGVSYCNLYAEAPQVEILSIDDEELVQDILAHVSGAKIV